MANVSKKEFEALEKYVSDTRNKVDNVEFGVGTAVELIGNLRKDITKVQDDARRALELAVDYTLIPCRLNILADRLAAAEKAGDKSIADLSARLDALARTVGSLAEKSHAHTMTSGDTFDVTVTTTWVDHKAGPVAPEKPTPKPKCPWCGGEAQKLDHTRLCGHYFCLNPNCGKGFWV
jgi:hypothetical protein